MTTPVTPRAADPRDQLAEQLFTAVIGAQDVLHVYVGDRLGLYEALAAADTMTPSELAERAGIAERYAREWLEQQASSGYLDLVADADEPARRRYRLPESAAEVLCRSDSPYFMAPLSQLLAGVAQALPKVLVAFRNGGGVPYAEFGSDVREGIARGNRPMFLNQLTDWVAAMPDIEARLRAGDGAGVADLGCGSGWSTIALARAYPGAVVHGIDLDEDSILAARGNAEVAGVAERVTFASRDAADPELAGRYDLVTLFETVHDMARPVEVLRAARAMLADGGAVLVADERVAEEFAAPAADLDRFNYGWSALHCLPASLAEPGSVATGTVMRPRTLRHYAEAAGFRRVTVLPVDHDLWWFYRLQP